MKLVPIMMNAAAESDVAAIAEGKRVLSMQSNALAVLSESLESHFADSVSALSNLKGRVVVSGIGKSGHIARKIAATLASTGTPAIFVHPSEASHGDLGMITSDDAILALSNSGETSELSDLVAYAKRFGLVLIAMTSKKDSALGRSATMCLTLPRMAEACPMGLAPMTSTTMMLALGDALAAAILERKGFNADDFRTFHPGGKLGKMLLRVDDVMHEAASLPLVELGMPMREAIISIGAGRVGCVGIVDSGGVLCGIITDGDLRRNIGRDILGLPVEAIMTATPRSVKVGSLAAESLHIMNTCAITALFVLDSAGKPVGLVHIHDLLKAGIV